ncbi:hypothetical protein ABZX51_009190 [Aspergillus tubingensis]
MPISAVTFATTILPVHPTTKGEGRGGGALGLNKDQSRGTEDALCSATGRNGRSPYQEPPGSSPIGSTSAGGGETVCLCRRILVSQERINIASITFSIVSVRRSSFLAGKLCKTDTSLTTYNLDTTYSNFAGAISGRRHIHSTRQNPSVDPTPPSPPHSSIIITTQYAKHPGSDATATLIVGEQCEMHHRYVHPTYANDIATPTITSQAAGDCFSPKACCSRGAKVG